MHSCDSMCDGRRPAGSFKRRRPGMASPFTASSAAVQARRFPTSSINVEDNVADNLEDMGADGDRDGRTDATNTRNRGQMDHHQRQRRHHPSSQSLSWWLATLLVLASSISSTSVSTSMPSIQLLPMSLLLVLPTAAAFTLPPATSHARLRNTCFVGVHIDAQPCWRSQSSTTLRASLASSTQGLSRYYQSMLSRNIDRQRFVTGKYPIIVTLQENPTRKWLNLGRQARTATRKEPFLRAGGGGNVGDASSSQPASSAGVANGARNTHSISTSELLVNGTAVDKSLASYSRFQWLDDDERNELHDRYRCVSMELLAEINVPKPGYVQIQKADGAGSTAAAMRNTQSMWRNPWKKRRALYEKLEDLQFGNARYQERLWVTGFTLASRKGILRSVDVADGHIDTIHQRSESMTLWPNEVHAVPTNLVERIRVKGNGAASQHAQTHGYDHHDESQLYVTGMSHDQTHSPSQPYASHQRHSQAAFTSLSSPLQSSVIEEHAVRPTATSSKSMPTPTRTATTTKAYAAQGYDDALLVSDGFLVPGKDRGGIYVVKNPSNVKTEWTICLTDLTSENRWFYHRAVWVDLTGDGRQSILTARAKLRKVTTSVDDGAESPKAQTTSTTERPRNGELVWLEMPEPHSFDKATGTPLDEDGTPFDPFSARHLPWKERVLAVGPDVMFNVADMDPSDGTIEVIASQFFDKKVTLHSIQRGPSPKVVFSRIIDDRCGAAFGGILADLDCAGVDGRSAQGTWPGTALQSQSNNRAIVIDSGSTVPSVQPGDSFSHVLVTSHECNYAETAIDGTESLEAKYRRLEQRQRELQQQLQEQKSQDASQSLEPDEADINTGDADTGEDNAVIDGGSLFAYKVPTGKPAAWKTEPWIRTTVATGFKVDGQLWNIINPGAPGFVYTFHARKQDAQQRKQTQRPMIAVAGDCAESAYVFRPERHASDGEGSTFDRAAQYKLMCEIKCGATVGSIGIGYEDLCDVEQESGYAKLYIPCYEKDKILVFAMGSGEDV